MKKTTSAIVLIDENGSILACHATGKPKDSGYDFPKGIVNENEFDIDAAKREFFEECGVELDSLFPFGSSVFDCGKHTHNKEKDIHIFLCPINEFPDLSIFKCKSFFQRDGKNIPEVDGYAILDVSEREKFNKVLWNKFPIIDSFNKKYREQTEKERQKYSSKNKFIGCTKIEHYPEIPKDVFEKDMLTQEDIKDAYLRIMEDRENDNKPRLIRKLKKLLSL